MTVKLTAKQEGFAQSVVEGLNQSDAYRAHYDTDGWLPSSIHEKASQLAATVKVSSRIEDLRGAIQDKLNVTQEQIMGELRGIAFANVEDLMSWGPDGVELKASEDLSRAQTVLVSEVQQTTTKDGGSIKLKVHDKLAALKEINKMQGNYAETRAPVSDTALDAIIRLAAAMSDAQLRAQANSGAIEGSFEVLPSEDTEPVD